MTENNWGRGDWMQTYTGKAFYPLDARAEDIVIEDIAHSLALQCRYNGHVDKHYSVAEHCVHLSHYVAPEDALWALLHDAPEAYIGDMVRPLKKHMPDFIAADDRLTAIIALKYGLEGTVIPAQVTAADIQICLNERLALLGDPPQAWAIDGDPLPGVTIHAWDWQYAELMYIDRFNELMFQRAANEWNARYVEQTGV